MKNSIYLYNLYFHKIRTIFANLDENNANKYSYSIIEKSNNEDELVYLVNAKINAFDEAICKIGFLRELVNENEILEEIFKHFIEKIISYPTRLVAKYFYLDQMTYKSIAKNSGIKINTVKTCVRRFRLEYCDKVQEVAKQKNIRLENFEWLSK